MSTAKKKNRKACWIMIEEGKYTLQDSSSLIPANGSYMENPCLSAFVHGNVFFGEIASKKLKTEKVSEFFSHTIEIHPNTMEICGLSIGGPVILISSNAFACRVWPSFQLRLNRIAFPSTNLSDSGFNIGNFAYAVAPTSVIIARSVTLSPVVMKNDHSQLQSLVKASYFTNYLSKYLDKAYVVNGQEIHLCYFGKQFTFQVDSVAGKDDSLQADDSVSTVSKPNENLTEKIETLSLDHIKQSNSFVASSTPLKNSSNSFQIFDKSPYKDDMQMLQDDFKSYNVFLLTGKTEITIKSSLLKDDDANNLPKPDASPVITFNDIGGLQKQIETLNDLVIAPIKNPVMFKNIGIQPLHGIILYGASGTGKSLLAKAVANELGGSIRSIAGSQVVSKFFGESETKLRAIFKEALTAAPCLVLIDELDSLCPRRDSTRTDAEKRLVAAFTSVLDDLNSSDFDKHVVVIGTTNRIDAIDPALRRSGRFDREVEVTIPSSTERAEILQKLLSKFSHNLTFEDMQEIAEKCHGYVGADLLAVCKEAGLNALKEGQQSGDDNVVITVSNLEYGLKQVSPSAMRELIVQVPKVFWKDIGGNMAVKQKLKHTVEWPLKNPEAFARLGIEPPRGVLLYGPPGCSKTLTAKALATESGLNFISIKGPELFSKYVGDSERAIRKIFSKARSAAPSIVFIDELDALAIERGGGSTVADRVLTTLLTEMDGVENRNDVIVIAATNRPDMIDKAFLRPGRIDRILHVPLPDPTTRRDVFEINFRKMPIDKNVDINMLVEQTESFSGAEICALCREAALAALDTNLEAAFISTEHFASAFKSVIPQTSDEMTKLYEKYEQTLQSRIK